MPFSGAICWSVFSPLMDSSDTFSFRATRKEHHRGLFWVIRLVHSSCSVISSCTNLLPILSYCSCTLIYAPYYQSLFTIGILLQHFGHIILWRSCLLISEIITCPLILRLSTWTANKMNYNTRNAEKSSRTWPNHRVMIPNSNDYVIFLHCHPMERDVSQILNWESEQ